MKHLILLILATTLAPQLSHAMGQRHAVPPTSFRIEGVIPDEIKIESATLYYQATADRCIGSSSGIFSDGGSYAVAQTSETQAIVTVTDGKYQINADLDPSQATNRCKFAFNYLELKVSGPNQLPAKIEIYNTLHNSLSSTASDLSQVKTVTFSPFNFFDPYFNGGVGREIHELGAIDDLSQAANRPVQDNYYVGFALFADPINHPAPYALDLIYKP